MRGGRREEKEGLMSSPHLTFINGHPLFIYSKGGTEEREGREEEGRLGRANVLYAEYFHVGRCDILRWREKGEAGREGQEEAGKGICQL
jgi:hypothetical protein